MAIDPDHLRQLSALGLTGEQMGAVLAIIADAVEAGPKTTSAGAERTRRWRERHGVTSQNVTKASHRDVTGDVTSDAKTVTSDASHVGARAEPKITNSSENTEKKESKKASKSTTPAASRGTRIPPDFAPDIEAAVAEGLPRAEAEREVEKFRDWWLAAPGARGLKANWPATWRTWYRKRIEERGKTGPPQRAGNGTGFNGKPTLGDIRNAALAAIAARDANGRPNLELLAGPERRPGTGNGDHRPADGVPRPADGPDVDRGDLLRGLLRVRAFPG